MEPQVKVELICVDAKGAKPRNASRLLRFDNLIARCRREARRIIGDGKPNQRYRLALICERLLASFEEIDASMTREQRLTLIGANPVDARSVRRRRDDVLAIHSPPRLLGNPQQSCCMC